MDKQRGPVSSLRQMMLREAYQNMTGPFTIDDASDLTDVVPCDLVDD
jgi:hypothetical protein